MNTTFFQKVSDVNQDFAWKDIFADVFKPHGKADMNDLLIAGIGDHIPSEDQMLKTWKKPWLFPRFGILGLMLSLLILVGYYMDTPGASVTLCIVAPFIMPLTVAVFYWEMNIPRNISLYEVFFMIFLGGILSLIANNIFLVLTGLRYVETTREQSFLLSYVQAPATEETAKFVAVYLLLKRKKIRYGVQGVLIGGAVGVGFSALESSLYAFSNNADTQIILLRAVWAFGGHVVWAALYGGALALVMQGGKLRFRCITDKLVIISFCTAYLSHALWNFQGTYSANLHMLPESLILFLNRMSRLYIDSAIIAVIPWFLMLHILRKSMNQIIAVDQQFNALARQRKEAPAPKARPAAAFMAASAAVPAAPPAVPAVPASAAALTVTGLSGVMQGKEFRLGGSGSLVFGRDASKANVAYPPDTRGVSSVHCEIKWKEGFLVLIDRGSTYGTFFGNGQKLEPNVPYKLQDNVRFYLAGEENQFRVHM